MIIKDDRTPEQKKTHNALDEFGSLEIFPCSGSLYNVYLKRKQETVYLGAIRYFGDDDQELTEKARSRFCLSNYVTRCMSSV